MKQTNKLGKKKQVKRKQPSDSTSEQSLPKKRKGGVSANDDESKVPIVHVPEDLIGKRVQHLCQSEEDGDQGEVSANWFKGCVLSMCGRGKNPLFEIKYDGYDDVWSFKLMKHLEDGVLKLIPLKEEDLLGASILHRLKVGCCEEWFKGKVLSIVPGSDPSNPEFSVEYEGEKECDEEVEDEDDEELIWGTHVEDYPLIEDYINGDLRLL